MEQKSLEIVYSSAKVSKRGLALLIDAFVTIFLALIIFVTSNSIVTKVPFYVEVASKREKIQDKSRLFSDDHILISEYVDSLTISNREKNEYMSSRISSFYEDKDFYIDTDPNVGYNSRRNKASNGSTTLFIEEDGEIKENPLCDPSVILSFYKDEVNNYCLKQFYQYPGYLETNKFFFLTGIIEALASLTVSYTIFYLVFPLTIFRKGKKSLGMYVFKIALVGKDGLSLRIGPYVGRFFFEYFVFIIFGFASFLISWAISFTMLLTSKRKQSLTDYVLNQYKVDVSKSDVYIDFYDYTHSKEASKLASLENKDFNIDNRKR